MYQADGLAWLERQADLAEAIIATRQERSLEEVGLSLQISATA
jgi:hypothetical protein